MNKLRLALGGKLILTFVVSLWSPGDCIRAETIFSEDFESHFQGFYVVGWNDWEAVTGGGAIEVSSGSHSFSTAVADGFKPVASGNLREAQKVAVRKVDLAGAELVRFEFDALARSSSMSGVPPSHNANLALGEGPGASRITWSAHHFDPNLPCWTFWAEGNASEFHPEIPFDRAVRLGMEVHYGRSEARGYARFTDDNGDLKTVETGTFSVSPNVLRRLDRVIMYQDFRDPDNYVGAQFDNLIIDRVISTDGGGEIIGADDEIVFYDFESDPELPLRSRLSDPIRTGANDGNPGGYLALTDAVNYQSTLIVLEAPESTQTVSGLRLQMDARVGNGAKWPADGFSVNLPRRNASVLTEPDAWRGFEENGIDDGLAVSFDSFSTLLYGSNGDDPPGLVVRVDGEKLFLHPMETVNGEAGDATSLQTGVGNKLFNVGTPSVLSWQPIAIDVSLTGQLWVWWKGQLLIDGLETGFVPDQAQFVLAGRTGGYSQNHHIDNVRIEAISDGIGSLPIGGGSSFSEPAPPVGGHESARRILPVEVRIGTEFQVLVLVKPGPSTTVYAVEERIPVGAVVEGVSENGSFDEVNGLIKWGPFFDNELRELSYTLSFVSSSTGVAEFDGGVSFDGEKSVVGGDSSVLRVPAEGGSGEDPIVDAGNRHLVDFRSRTGKAFLFRVTGSNEGTVWGTDVFTDDSILGKAAVHAGLLQIGETGVVRVTMLPGLDSYAGSESHGVVSRSYGSWPGSYQIEAFSAKPVVLRTLPPEVAEGERFRVHIEVSPKLSANVYAVEERLPDGVFAAEISNNGRYDEVNGLIKWGPFFDSEPRELSYVLTLLNDTLGSLALEGSFSIDGHSGEIGGDSLVMIAGEFIPPASHSPLEVALRSLPLDVAVGERFRVRIDVSPGSSVEVYAVEERVPTGTAVFDISNSGSFDEANGLIKWGPFFDKEKRELSYTLSFLNSPDGIAEFGGAVSLDGEGSFVGGDSSILIQEDVASPQSVPSVVCPSDGGLISFVNPRGPVMDIDGVPANSEVMGQLYVGATINQLEPICEPIPVLKLGVFNGGEMAVPGTAGGEVVFVQLRAWKGARDFASATIRGQSDLLALTLKTPGEVVPAPSLGISSFRLAEVLTEARFVQPVLEGAAFILRWTGGGRLQESASLDGPYTDSINQSNPQEVLVTKTTSRFFRLVHD